MSQEIMEGIRTIEREKGIETGTLVAALEDALLAAYKKTPGASRHAEVILDDEGEFRVFSIEIPSDLEERLVEVAGHGELHRFFSCRKLWATIMPVRRASLAAATLRRDRGSAICPA